METGVEPVKKKSIGEPEPGQDAERENEASPPERPRVSVHIMMNAELLDNVREMADYAAAVGVIKDDPRGNVTDFINWCILVGKEALRQHCLKRRKFI